MLWEKIAAEAMSSWMRKHYGCAHVAEGEGVGRKLLQTSRFAFLFLHAPNQIKGIFKSGDTARGN